VRHEKHGQHRCENQHDQERTQIDWAHDPDGVQRTDQAAELKNIAESGSLRTALSITIVVSA
jgi:hypothetical protein